MYKLHQATVTNGEKVHMYDLFVIFTAITLSFIIVHVMCVYNTFFMDVDLQH
jgi:cell division protein FtsL